MVYVPIVLHAVMDECDSKLRQWLQYSSPQVLMLCSDILYTSYHMAGNICSTNCGHDQKHIDQKHESYLHNNQIGVDPYYTSFPSIPRIPSKIQFMGDTCHFRY